MFTFKRSSNKDYAEFEGPGLGYYSVGVLVPADVGAEAICRLLARAHQAGREAKAAEIRNALNVREG